MTAFRAVVLEHFRHPRNRAPLDEPSVSVEGANPLCGDRIRLELRVDAGAIVAAGFTADACAICIASASVLTDHVRGMAVAEAASVDARWIDTALEGEPPAGRAKCALLPLDTLRRALDELELRTR
ncbi:MAG: system FeS assembly protein NifU family [Gemmatimonadetes bacterium]|nr:system FeS assembly protein NifU family [Gemmatimonadota bacterium]